MFTSTSTSPIKVGHPVRDRLKSYFAAVHRHSADKRSIRQLQKLDDRALRDIGVTRTEVLRTRPRPLLQLYLD